MGGIAPIDADPDADGTYEGFCEFTSFDSHADATARLLDCDTDGIADLILEFDHSCF